MVTHHIFLEQYKQKGNIKISHLGSEVFLLLNAGWLSKPCLQINNLLLNNHDF